MNIPFLDISEQYKSLQAEIEEAALKVLRSQQYINGSYVRTFEKEVSEYLSVEHAIGCSSGTAALVLALRACGVKPGDEVITSPFTFFATAEAIASIGAFPVFVDVKQEDYNIDPDLIEAAVTHKTKVILPVHIFGSPADMDKILGIAEKHNLRVIEDAAQAIGSEYKGQKAGTIGDIGCFSFYPTKNLGGCGDGGMVVTNDDNLATILIALKEHGAGKNGAEAVELLGGEKEEVVTFEQQTELYNPYKYYNYLIGYNSRLDAIQAAILSVKLKHLDEFNKKRSEIASKYFDGLTDKIKKPVYNRSDIKSCWHQFVIRSGNKEELSNFLGERDIGSGSFYPVPLHKQKAFNLNNCKTMGDSLPVAEEIASQSVCLPIFPELSELQVQYVIDAVNAFYKEKD